MYINLLGLYLEARKEKRTKHSNYIFPIQCGYAEIRNMSLRTRSAEYYERTLRLVIFKIQPTAAETSRSFG